MRRTFSEYDALLNQCCCAYPQNFSRKTKQIAISLQVDTAFLINTSHAHSHHSVLIYTCKEFT